MEEVEKAGHHETIEHVKSINLADIDRAAEKRLLWKLDLHVVPILMFLFLLAFLDRINIGNARLQGLEKDLHMKNHDYNLALFIFFIPYILLEVPSNLLLKKIAPSWWISGIMFGWGMLNFGLL
jgi:fucose permease